MTIKEAFQQLANATKKGMKNPFFIMRSLNKNFSEIADKIEGGGGGAGGADYTTTPSKTGSKWIDNKDVYHVVIDLENAVSISQTGTFVDLTDVSSLNIDTLICGWTKPTKTDTFDPTALEVAEGKLKGSFTSQWSVKTIYIQFTIAE